MSILPSPEQNSSGAPSSEQSIPQPALPDKVSSEITIPEPSISDGALQNHSSFLPEQSIPTIQQSSEPTALSAWWRLLAPAIALSGGVFGILGAFYTELVHGDLLVAFVGAPIMEEALKPSGVYLLLAKWPRVLRSQLYTALLSALGGLAFALIENVMYLNVFYPEHSQELVLWRYTVCIGVHTLCSFIYGFGINQKLLASVKGETKLLSSGKRFFFTAMILHSLYNISAMIIGLTMGSEF